MAKKPKPATVGEKIAKDAYEQAAVFDRQSQPLSHAEAYIARRIDAAIKRAVKAERQRCADIVRHINRPEALAEIESGGIP